MPPRQPPSPPALTVLSTLSCLAAGYVAVAVVEAGRAACGLLAGVALRRFEVAPPFYLVRAVQDGTPSTTAGWLLFALGGPVLLIGVAYGAAGLVSVMRTKGMVRSGALSLILVSLAWIPTLIVAGALGRGPVGGLYAVLGEPQAGRWAAAGLGALALWLAMGAGTRAALATGRIWLRTDNVVFRRRLVRAAAGYPLAIAMGVLALLLGWMGPVAAVGWAAVILIFAVVRTS